MQKKKNGMEIKLVQMESKKYVSFVNFVQGRKQSYFKSLSSVLDIEVDMIIYRIDRKMIHQGIKKIE